MGCHIAKEVSERCVSKLLLILWTKIADYTVNFSWGTEGSNSASASTGGTTPPTAFTTFLNSAEVNAFR